MINLNKPMFGALISGTLLFASFGANAVVIDFDLYGDDANKATDGSGLTSRFVPSSNTGLSPGLFIETFDSETAIPGNPPGSTEYNHETDNAGCSVNTAAVEGIHISVTGGGFEVRANHAPGVAAVPGGSSSDGGIGGTCFGYTPAEGAGHPASVTVDYAEFLDPLGPAVKIDYFGFYWGSVDTYNDFSFFDGDDLVAEILGAELVDQLGGSSGNQTDPKTNPYVNLFFSPEESFTRFTVSTNGVAGEFDNIVIGLNSRPVPIPATLALLGLGLFALGFTRQRA